MTWINNFAWIDEHEALHIDVPRMLNELGIPDTAENRDEYTEVAAAHLQKLLRNRPAVIKITK